jgi:hypothetical protein
MRSVSKAVAALAATGVAVCALNSSVLATIVTYDLHNHPDGDVNPPPYGMRLDELYDVTGNHDNFTFNFDDATSQMFLDYDTTAATIHIYGHVAGGRDIGGAYAVDQYLGQYLVNFSFTLGVQAAPGDDDLIVNTLNHANSGTIITPLGDTISLYDERGMSDFSFRFGNEDNDAGHRGYNGLSGWGWMNHHQPGNHIESGDWLFTAVRSNIPTPGSCAVLLAGGLLAARRRRV